MMEEDYLTFRKKLLRIGEKGHQWKIRNTLGTEQIFKALRKEKKAGIGRDVTEPEFYAIIRHMHQHFAEELLKGNAVIFPYRMGRLELRKYVPEPQLKDGKLKVTAPVDWEKTMHLWHEDPEALKDRLVVRHEGMLYHVKYSRYKAAYNNQSYYNFRTCRALKQALGRSINERKTDTLYTLPS